jgi:hypothetical protein
LHMDTIQPNVGSRHPTQPVITASFLLGVIVLAVEIFRWTLVEWLTPLLEPILELALGCAFLSVLLWTLFGKPRSWAQNGPGHPC